MNKIYIIHSQAFDEQFMSYSTFCVHRGGNIIDSPRNIGLIRLTHNCRFGPSYYYGEATEQHMMY